MTLFHPDLTYGPFVAAPAHSGRPARLLFMDGYCPKGLYCLDTVEALRAWATRLRSGIRRGALGRTNRGLRSCKRRSSIAGSLKRRLPRCCRASIAWCYLIPRPASLAWLRWRWAWLAGCRHAGWRPTRADTRRRNRRPAARVDAPARHGHPLALLDPVRYEMTCTPSLERGTAPMAEFIRQCADSVRV